MPEDEDLELTSEVEEPEADEVDQSEPRYYTTLEDGTEVDCDINGNPLEETEPEPEAEPEVRATTEYTSPYSVRADDADSVTLTKSELRDLIRQEIGADRVASAQQQRAARELGVNEEVFTALSPYLAQAEAMVPTQLRGTKQGATMTLYAAMALDSEQNGFDVGKTLAKFAKSEAVDIHKPKAQKVLAASERTATPRATGGGNARPLARKVVNDTASRALGGSDVLSLLQRERKITRG